MNVIEMRDVVRAFGRGNRVLEDLDFTLEAGSVVGLLGRNGAGKTTLLRIVMGMLHPQQGSVRVFGEDPAREPLFVKSRVGYVSEEQILPAAFRAREVIAMHRSLFPSWDGTMERELLERFPFSLDEVVRNLSKGQQRQLALLCAVCHRPELLVLDEPAGGLDPAARREFLEIAIAALNRDGSTILFSSHYMGDVERLADRVALLHGGRILVDSPLEALAEQFCLVAVKADALGPDALRGVQGCIAARRRGETVSAVFHGTEAGARRRLHAALPGADPTVRHAPLEEMFIEIVEGS